MNRELHKTEILKNYFNQDFLLDVKHMVDECVNHMDDSAIVRATHGNYYPLSKEIQQKVNDLLPFLPNEIGFVTLLRHIQPTGLHTDTNVSDEDLLTTDINAFARTFIIPLETQDTHTITFNQCLPPGTPGKQLLSFISDLPEINDVSSEVLETYFPRSENHYWANKLSIETVFPWVAGDVLVFDRNRIHTGDDHIGNKNGLVIWTTI